MKKLLIVKFAFVIVFGAVACKSVSRGAMQENVTEQQTGDIIEKYWKLTELRGNPVTFQGDDFNRTPHFVLKTDESRVIGHGGCNSFTGVYEVDFAAGRIKFSQMIATMMACIDMEVEQELLRVFEMADNYSLSDDGKILSLNRARMAPLARFEVEYLR